jgi:uncharacterized membrane protein YqjE
MNQPFDTEPSDQSEATGSARMHPSPPHANWREALMDLIAARFALFQLESKELSEQAAKRATFIAAACACTFFAWVLILIGGISMLSNFTGWRWDAVALALATIHLLAGIMFAKSAKDSGNAAFPVTRAEFQKDREWIENFSKDKKSNG